MAQELNNKIRSLRAELSQAGLSRARQFTWEHTARGTARIYDAAADARRGDATKPSPY